MVNETLFFACPQPLTLIDALMQGMDRDSKGLLHVLCPFVSDCCPVVSRMWC